MDLNDIAEILQMDGVKSHQIERIKKYVDHNGLRCLRAFINDEDTDEKLLKRLYDFRNKPVETASFADAILLQLEVDETLNKVVSNLVLRLHEFECEDAQL